MKTRIYIVRHSETIGNVEKRLTGREDYEITDYGNYLINKLTKELENVKFNRLYSSTSVRTAKTIERLASINHKQIERKQDLCEMYFGVFDGYKWSDVNIIQPEIKQNQIKNNTISGIANQESMEEVAERMYRCILKISIENLGEKVLICSHGVAIEAFLRKITNVPFCYERERYCQYNVAINIVDYDSETQVFNIIDLANTKYLD